MAPDVILQSDLLDIIFEERNKQYGAYAIRKYYGRRLFLSLMTVLMAAAFFTLLYFVLPGNSARRGTPLVLLPRDYYIDSFQPPPPLPPQAQVARRPARREEFAPVLSRDSILKQTPVPAIEGLEPGPVNESGPAGNSVTGESGIAPAIVAQPIVKSIATEPEEPLRFSEIAPEFPGGMKAFQRFMQTHLRPPEDMQGAERVTVKVRFVVDKNGNISAIQITQSGGELFDAEVKKVVQKMPAWKPGMQEGKPVAVWFSLPVVFQSADE